MKAILTLAAIAAISVGSFVFGGSDSFQVVSDQEITEVYGGDCVPYFVDVCGIDSTNGRICWSKACYSDGPLQPGDKPEGKAVPWISKICGTDHSLCGHVTEYVTCNGGRPIKNPEL